MEKQLSLVGYWLGLICTVLALILRAATTALNVYPLIGHLSGKSAIRPSVVIRREECNSPRINSSRRRTSFRLIPSHGRTGPATVQSRIQVPLRAQKVAYRFHGLLTCVRIKANGSTARY